MHTVIGDGVIPPSCRELLSTLPMTRRHYRVPWGACAGTRIIVAAGVGE
ncbi:hypothetical protein OG824_06965 [Streptomyces prunicolor]|nr:hypothetical protein [Streptomyces prunicolor]MCX5234969.1 hypothetical protein [Streptomyces prunicolor]